MLIVGTFHCKTAWAHPIRHIGDDRWAQQSRGHFIFSTCTEYFEIANSEMLVLLKKKNVLLHVKIHILL